MGCSSVGPWPGRVVGDNQDQVATCPDGCHRLGGCQIRLASCPCASCCSSPRSSARGCYVGTGGSAHFCLGMNGCIENFGYFKNVNENLIN